LWRVGRHKQNPEKQERDHSIKVPPHLEHPAHFAHLCIADNALVRFEKEQQKTGQATTGAFPMNPA
jgi:hypothetical protein